MTRVSATEKGRRQRAYALEQVIAYLLSEGLEETGLRRLAQAAGTSDRMLIYYFGSKEALLREAFSALSDALLAQLDTQFPKAQYSPKKLKKISLALADDPAARGTLKLWFELLGRSLRPNAPLKVQAQQLATRWESWLATKLPEDRRSEAPTLFAEIEGLLLLYCLNH
jgi:AcrR family transcriptional regulator